jgi:C-terminal processing protease CtpA/Prc
MEKGDDYDKVFPRPKSGLQIMYNPDQDIEVHFVSPNTPADVVGFKKGDIVKKINGIDVQRYDGIIAIRKLLREDAGTTYTFEILRENERMEKRLVLQELF